MGQGKQRRKGDSSALAAVLALCIFAGCSSDSEDDTLAYCGTWTPTSDLIDYLKTELSSSGNSALVAAANSLGTGSAAPAVACATGSLSVTLNAGDGEPTAIFAK